MRRTGKTNSGKRQISVECPYYHWNDQCILGPWCRPRTELSLSCCLSLFPRSFSRSSEQPGFLFLSTADTCNVSACVGGLKDGRNLKTSVMFCSAEKFKLLHAELGPTLLKPPRLSSWQIEIDSHILRLAECPLNNYSIDVLCYSNRNTKICWGKSLLQKSILPYVNRLGFSKV